MPAALALALLAVPLISTLYQYGRFTAVDVWQTRAALLGYSVGLLGLIAVKILAPGFYARHDMRTPVRIAFVTLLVSQTMAVILMFQIGHAGLTLSISLGACLNAALLYSCDAPARHLPAAARLGTLPLARRCRAAACWAPCCGGRRDDAFWLAAALWAKVGRLAMIIAAGAVAYFGACGWSASASPTSTGASAASA